MLYLQSFLRKGVSLDHVWRNQNLEDLNGAARREGGGEGGERDRARDGARERDSERGRGISPAHRILEQTANTTRLSSTNTEKDFFDNLLVRIHFIIEMILMDKPCAMAA